jgi:hypothetical protein
VVAQRNAQMKRARALRDCVAPAIVRPQLGGPIERRREQPVESLKSRSVSASQCGVSLMVPGAWSTPSRPTGASQSAQAPRKPYRTSGEIRVQIVRA